MSYTKRYREEISTDVTVRYYYPASEKGGYGDETVTVRIPVDVNINVDTTPFDKSVEGCNTTVNTLTGAVAATEAAQIASIDYNSQKIGSTVIDGFFTAIRSEISQQIMELTVEVDSILIHLHKMAKQCVGKHKQMETDYNRISGRYMKIFDDLNNELENRIFELDKPAFVFKRGSDKQTVCVTGNDLAGTVTVFGRESANLQAKISASITKKRALDTIRKANIFLLKQKKTDRTINESMLNNNIEATLYSPVCFIETQNEENQIDKNVYQADFLSKMQENEVISILQSKNSDSISNEKAEQIRQYFNAEVNTHYASGDSHTNRVRENILKMLNFNSIKCVI